MKLMKNIYKEPNLEIGVESKKQAIIDEEKFIKTELDINKVDLETSTEAEKKKKLKTLLTRQKRRAFERY